MIPTKFYRFPFAEAGDVTTIPDDSQPDGSESYEEGFPAKYQQNPLSGGFNILRTPFNQLMKDATTNLQEYQAWSVPNFITSADNDGSPFSYGAGARAIFTDGRIYMSNQASNTDEPVTTGVISPKWILQDVQATQATIFNNVTFDSPVANGNAVYWSSGGSEYAQALANGAAPQQVLGIADVTNSRVVAFGRMTGLSGLTPGAIYYLSTTVAGTLTTTKPASNVVQVGIAQTATVLFINIQAEIPGSFLPVGTLIDYAGTDGAQDGFLLADGSAVSRATYAILFGKLGTTWGIGDGSTTFNLPDTRRASSVGTGGTALSGPGNALGNTFTSQQQAIPTSALPTHNHGVTDPGHTHTYESMLSNQTSPDNSSVGFVTNGTHDTGSSQTDISINNAGTGSATLNTYGPSYVVDKQIYTGVF